MKFQEDGWSFQKCRSYPSIRQVMKQSSPLHLQQEGGSELRFSLPPKQALLLDLDVCLKMSLS